MSRVCLPISSLWHLTHYIENNPKINHNKNMEMNLGKYKHFKGDVVTVFYIAEHTETGEEFVIYEHNDKIWARPKKMFLEEVDKPEIGYKGPRFQYAEE
ncbi:MAG: DUF1653 domain-containing protein [Ignavibacteriaceae bacterium]|nr:DUF1653 domain-containing protein [Ignavibacteriaceae bacterium]